jgi:hypothetical protein
VKIAHQKLHDAEAAAGHEARWPHAHHAAPANLGCDQPERNDEREERQLASHHCAQVEQIEPGQRGERHQRNAEGAECDRSGVADQREFGGFERLEAKADHQRAADRDGGAESRRAFDERAETECEQQRLHAAITGHSGDLFLQHRKLPRVDRELIDEDRVDDEPADGKKSKRGAVRGGGQGKWRRHAVHPHRNPDRDDQCDERGDVGPHMPEREQAEQEDDRDCGDQRRSADAADRGVVLGPSHE